MIEDTNDEGTTVVTKVSIKADGTMTAKVVDNPCHERRGDGEPDTMKRVKQRVI